MATRARPPASPPIRSFNMWPRKPDLSRVRVYTICVIAINVPRAFEMLANAQNQLAENAVVPDHFVDATNLPPGGADTWRFRSIEPNRLTMICKPQLAGNKPPAFVGHGLVDQHQFWYALLQLASNLSAACGAINVVSKVFEQ